MLYSLLPPVKEDKKLDLPHFPTPFHAAVFRLWETVPAKQIAHGLGIAPEAVQGAADAMGLPPQKNMEHWKSRGYITTIRNAWHILPYEQLLAVLDMTEEDLEKALREEDFLGIKLGSFKPYCESIRVETLNEAQEAQLARIKQVMETECADLFEGKAPFDFLYDQPEADEAQTVNTDSDGIRMIFSYQGLLTTSLDRDIAVSYPESLLKRYRDYGVNALWVSVVLYQLVPFPFDEKFSTGWEDRQARLRELIALAAKYGIKIYLYLNEPRAMPLHFFEKYPELQGRTNRVTKEATLCTSDPRVLAYVRDGVRALAEAVPGLGGFFLINQSENMTHCKSRPEGEECPRCKDTPLPKLIADVITAIHEGAMAADPTLRIIAWTWAWTRMTPEECLSCIDMLPEGIILQANSEAQMPLCIGGIPGEVRDYSISQPGPGEWAKGLWSHALARGLEVSAKVQLNVTWECSTIPFLPVFDLLREHMIGLKNTGVKHMMMSWTLGGYPSINLKVASACLDNPDEAAYDALLKEEFGTDWQRVKKAAAIFSEAFREFPFNIGCAYNGPQNPGPSNLLHLNPTGFGATMTCYCYDDLTHWRSIYPEEIYREQFRKLAVRYRDGLAEIESMDDCEFKQAAWAGYLLFYSSYLQTDFIMKRDAGKREALREILAEERKNAVLMYRLMQKNPAIGYEAANHYYFNKAMLAEKIISCDTLTDML